MARLLIAILAILALVASPITASAATIECGVEASRPNAMASMDEPPGEQPSAPITPCCDKALKNCAATCASICAGAVAVLSATPSGAALAAQVAPEPGNGPAVHPHRPPGPDRPPKLLA